MEKKRSVAIIFLGLFLVITYSYSFIHGISYYFIKWDFHRGFPGVVIDDWIGILFLIAGVGLLMYKDWARKLCILLFAIKSLLLLQSIYIAINSPLLAKVKFPTYLYWYPAFYIAIYLILIFTLFSKKQRSFFETDNKRFITIWTTGLSIFYLYVFVLVFKYISSITNPRFLRYAFEAIFPTIIKMVLPPLIIGSFLFYTLRDRKYKKMQT